MKAFVLDRYGKKRALRSAEVPIPELRDDEVLVEVHAAGVNLLDSKIRDGEFKLILPYRLPLILGHDVAGVVVKVGPRVRQFKPGDEVYARPDDFRIGTFAEFVAGQGGIAGAQAQGPHDGRSRFHPPGGLDGMAGAGREGQPEEGAEGLHSGRLRRRRHFRHPVGQASGRNRRHDDERGQCRAREEPGRRRRHRLQDAGLRGCPARLRRGAEQPGRQDARKVSSRAQARRQAHLHLRAARPRVRQGNRGTRVREAGHAAAELRRQAKGASAEASATHSSS